jgi:adenylate cyclase
VDSKRVTRKLRAILSADVQGYSRLMGDDEVATFKTITEYREIFSSIVTEHNGRVVDSPGDNILSEFASVVDAVQCAVEIQKVLKAKNEDLPEDRRMIFRIGVNLGDVIHEDDRIYGDGVNIAARLESLAEGGGICLSGTAYDHIENKLALGYEFFGEHTVKNIAKPVRVYKISTNPDLVGDVLPRKKTKWPKKWVWVSASSILVLIVSAALIWNNYFRLPDIGKTEKRPLELAEGPAIAVLPFVNTNGESENEYICDGITENIIAGLSRCPHLFVISSNSVFTYKGKPVKIKKVAHELGAKYVVEGSVQLANQNVRITVQVINATNDYHIWAKKYDRKLDNIFALQDEITLDIILAFQIKLTYGEQLKYKKIRVTQLEAYLKTFKAWEYLRKHNKAANALARQEIKEVIDIDPKYAVAYVLLGTTHILDILMGSSPSNLISFAKANDSFKKALELDKDNSYLYLGLGVLYLMKGEHENAIAAEEKAIALNPNGADAYCELGFILYMSGRSTEAVEVIKKALRLNPKPPAYYYFMLGHAYRGNKNHEKAIESYKKSVVIEPDAIFAHIGLAVSYMKLGRKEEAAAEAKKILKIDPKFSLDNFEKAQPHIDPNFTTDMVEELRKAGLK